MCSHFILVNEIFGIDFLIRLRNDSNQKVKQDNENQKLIEHPDKPNDVDHGHCHWMVGFPGNPLGVERWTDVTDTILNGLYEINQVNVDSTVISVIDFHS